MLFHTVEKEASMLAGASSAGVLKMRLGVLIVCMSGIIIMFGLAILAHLAGWSDGAGKIVTFASTVAGGGLGLLLGEKSGAKAKG